MIKIANIEIYHDIQLSFGTSDVKRTVIKQNSEDTHILRIKLYDNQNNEMIIDSNWSINISALKGDKTHILNTNNISVKDNTVYVTMTKQMLTASGTEHCELIIQDGEQVLFSDTFLIYVEPNVQDGSFIESSDEYDSIVDTLGYVQEKKDRVDQLTEEIEETKVDINNTYDELKIAVEETNDLIQENQIIKSNEADRQLNETIRQTQEIERETNTATAISNANSATSSANEAAENANTAIDNANTATQNANTATANANNVASQLLEDKANGLFKGEKGDQGEKGEKGDTGESGVTVPTNGFFTLSIDENGDLYCYYNDADNPPTFELDDNGDLYFVVADN